MDDVRRGSLDSNAFWSGNDADVTSSGHACIDTNMKLYVVWNSPHCAVHHSLEITSHSVCAKHGKAIQILTLIMFEAAVSVPMCSGVETKLMSSDVASLNHPNTIHAICNERPCKHQLGEKIDM